MKMAKKLGAGVLSAAMLAGGGLQSALADNITVTGDNTADITGYQTEAPEDAYAANVEWGDLVFVYDRGTFDPTTGNYVRATSDRAPVDSSDLTQGYTGFTGVEAGATEGQVNKWYGFDGTNNKVTVTNLSTQDIAVNASATIENSFSEEDVTAFLYYDEYMAKDVYYALVASSPDGVVSANHAHTTFDTTHHSTDYELQCWIPNDEDFATPIGAPARDANGAIVSDTLVSRYYYVNITGDPGEDFSEDEDELSTLGNVTLTFNKWDGDELGDTLTVPSNP